MNTNYRAGSTQSSQPTSPKARTGLSRIAGMTLVELMVSLGLFSVASLALASLFGENAKQTSRARAEIELETQTLDFSTTFDVLLSQTSMVYACRCGSDQSAPNPRCAFYDVGAASAITPDCQLGGCGVNPAAPADGVPIQLLVFETEDTLDPSQVSTANCRGGGANPRPAATGTRVTARGCKRAYELEYLTPIRMNPAGVSRPGTLRINLCRGGLTVAGTATTCLTPQTVSEIDGAYSVRCGHPTTEQAPGGPANMVREVNSFRLDFRAKSLASSLRESYAPVDAASFPLGTHRGYSLTSYFRNLTTRGVQFGKIETFSCDRVTSTTGNCCSGYSFSTGVCIPTNACVLSGQKPSVDAASSFTECCSHQLISTAGGFECS